VRCLPRGIRLPLSHCGLSHRDFLANCKRVIHCILSPATIDLVVWRGLPALCRYLALGFTQGCIREVRFCHSALACPSKPLAGDAESRIIGILSPATIDLVVWRGSPTLFLARLPAVSDLYRGYRFNVPIGYLCAFASFPSAAPDALRTIIFAY